MRNYNLELWKFVNVDDEEDILYIITNGIDVDLEDIFDRVGRSGLMDYLEENDIDYQIIFAEEYTVIEMNNDEE